MFAISDKVICIEGSNANNILIKGQIYVINDIWKCNCRFCEGKIMVKVVGDAEEYYEGIRVGWKVTRFRKLSEIQEENSLRKEHENLAQI